MAINKGLKRDIAINMQKDFNHNDDDEKHTPEKKSKFNRRINLDQKAV